MNRRATAALSAVLIGAALVLAGCASNDGITSDYNSSNAGGNYVSGDGSIKTIAAADRGKPVSFSSTTATGSKVSSADYSGKVLVLNFWFAQCGPCIAEAPELEKLVTQFAGKDVSFLGVNIDDDAPQALAFQKAHDVSYPTVLDAADGSVRFAFAGQVSPTTTPTTLVIDKKGRVAARFSGLISSPSVVATVIDDLLKDD